MARIQISDLLAKAKAMDDAEMRAVLGGKNSAGEVEVHHAGEGTHLECRRRRRGSGNVLRVCKRLPVGVHL